VAQSAPEAAAPGNSASVHGKAGNTQPGRQVEIITFAIGDDQYGVDIMAVREIKGWTGVTPLPRQPDYVRGVLNLRGAMVPVVDLRCRFGQGTTEATPMHIAIIVEIDGQLVGLLADRVLDIVSFDTGNIQPVPQVARGTSADMLSGLVTVENGMIALIDLSRLVPAEDLSDAA
jgi:purine-binding chemotaxis protein CheW